METTTNEEIQTVEFVNDLPIKEAEYKKIISEKREQYKDLTINGITDKAGYKAVETARIDMKNTRVGVTKYCKNLRDEATRFSKAVIAKEKEIVGEIESIENALQKQTDAIDAEKLKLENERTESRLKTIHQYSPLITADAIKHLNDELFNNMVANAKEAFEIEQKRLADELAEKKAEEERQAKIKADNEAEAKRLEAIKKDQEEREKVKKEMDELQDKRLSELLKVTTVYTDSGSINMTRLWEETESQYQTILKNRTEQFNKMKADQEKAQAKIDADNKRIAEENAAAAAKIEEEKKKIFEQKLQQRINALLAIGMLINGLDENLYYNPDMCLTFEEIMEFSDDNFEKQVAISKIEVDARKKIEAEKAEEIRLQKEKEAEAEKQEAIKKALQAEEENRKKIADKRVEFLLSNGYYNRAQGCFSKRANGELSIPFDVDYKILSHLTDKEFEDRFNQVEELINKENEALKSELEAKQKAQLAPDKEKLKVYANSLKEIKAPSLTTNDAQQIANQAYIYLQKAIEILNGGASNL